MTDREKLIELLHKEVRCPGTVANCMDCPYQSNDTPCDEFEATADMLIAHGVTIREPGEQSDDDCFREKIEHQLKGIYEHLREIDRGIDTLRAQTLPLRENVIPWFTESNVHKNVEGLECHCGAEMKGESK